MAAAVLAAAVAGAALGVIASRGGAAPLPTSLKHAKDVNAVVSQVQRSFGDRRIVSASVDGSLLTVKLSVPHPRDVGTADTIESKAVFEAQVLAHVVADWMRSHGQQPITTVRYRNADGRVVPATSVNGDPVENDANLSPLASGKCEAAARTAAATTAALKLVSAKTLPWMHGTCVFMFETAHPLAGSDATMGLMEKIIPAIGGPPNLRPWFFELDTDRSTESLDGASWMPGSGGSTWARPGLGYPLGHG